MKNISLKQTKFQSFIKALIYVFQLMYTEVPIPDSKPYVFISPNAAEVEKLKLAHQAFELKKRGVR